MTERYAIYFAPGRDDPLTKRAETWLGYSAWSGSDMRQPEFDNIPAEQFADLTSAPRRYGFHATLKAPMRLAEGRTEVGLVAALKDYSSKTKGVTIDRLVLRWIGPFLALVPNVQAKSLSDFAASVVRTFDDFRAPVSESDLEKRRKSPLSERQDRHLVEWGYPYVLDEFFFHMTLSGPVEMEQRNQIERAAKQWFAPFIDKPLAVDRLALSHEAAPGVPFKIINSFAQGNNRGELPRTAAAS